MKTRTYVSLLALLSLLGGIVTAGPVGTAFTYQGQLADSGQPAEGNYDFRFAIYDAAEGGSQVGATVTNSPVDVSDGLFTVELDFGASVFTGDALWLEIGVRTNDSTGDFTLLGPRQALTPSPYALHAAAASEAANSTSFSGALAGDVSGTQGATTVERVRGRPVSSAAPAASQYLRFNGTQWAPAAVALDSDVSGTLADARLSANVALRNAPG